MTTFWTPEQAARLLRVSSQRVRQLADIGRLSIAARAGRMRLFDPDDVRRLAEARAAARQREERQRTAEEAQRR